VEIRPVKFGNDIVYIEVADATPGQPEPPVAGSAQPHDGPPQRDYEVSLVSAAGDLIDSAERVRTTVRTFLAPVAEAAKQAGPKEWTVELSIGFKGAAGIPFLASGEANAGIKVTAKWGG
jgi:hypothetical protein